MKMQVRGNLLLPLVIVLSTGWIIESMELNEQKKEFRRRFSYSRPDGISRTVEQMSLAPNSDQYAVQYQHGMSLIHMLMEGKTTVSAIRTRMSQLSLQDQQEIIKTTGNCRLDWMFGIACDSYAGTIARDDVMQFLFDDSNAAQTALQMGPRADRYLASKLHETFKGQIDRLAFVSQRGGHRLYNLSVDAHKCQDAFIMLPALSDDIVCIQRDFTGKSCCPAQSVVLPLLVSSSRNRGFQVFDPVMLSHFIEQARQPGDPATKSRYFDGRAYQISHDGSFMLGFAETRLHDIDTIILFDRTPDNKFEPLKAISLSHGILTRLYALDKHETVKGIPLCAVLYDIQTSFAIRPYERMAACIDTMGNIQLINLNSGFISQLTTGGNALALGWSPDGKSIAWSTADGKLRIKRLDGGTIEKDCGSDHQIRKIQWGVDGSKILLVTPSYVELIRVADGSIVGRYGAAQAIVQATLSDDATKILIASADKNISFWDVSSHACIQKAKLDNAYIIEIQLSPDGRYASFTCEQKGSAVFYIWHLEHNMCVEYHDINETSLPMITAELRSGWPSCKMLSLPQMMLFVATCKAQGNKTFSVARTHYLTAQFAALAPHLKKSIESKIVIK